MLSALKIEWMKVKNYRTFWILLAITIVTIPAGNYYIYYKINDTFQGKGKMIIGSPFAFPDVWQVVSWNSTLLFLVPALLIITLTTNEFVYKTHRQNVIDGWSRNQFISVKIVEVVLLSLLTTLLVVLTSLGLAFLGNKVPTGVSIWQNSRYVFFYFVQMLSYSMIAFLLSMLIKRAGLVIGVYLIYMLVENIIVGIFHHVYNTNSVDYLPEQVTDNLIPLPYGKALLAQDSVSWEHHIPIYLIVAFVYLVGYCLLTGRLFVKSDL